MAEHKQQPEQEEAGLKNWLDNLQQESWQLELLISGFVLFLLIGGWGPVTEMEYDLRLLQFTIESYYSFNFIYYVLRTAYLSLLICLLFHVVLRGIWIAAIGLRSVSGEIDYDSLRYQSKFTKRLRRRVGSFDKYIERMERNCSVVFSLAFMIIFCFLSLISWAIVSILIQQTPLWFLGESSNGNWLLRVADFVSILVMVSGIIYFVDFVTLGWLKRNRWLAKPYYYIYVMMGWVTLARFYRPIYYNLIDNRFGRKLGMALPVIIVLTLAIASIQQISYDYYPVYQQGGKVWQDNNNYDDEDPDLYEQIWRMSLASKYVENNYVEAFIPYRPVTDNDRLKAIDPDLEVSQYTGTKLNGAFTLGERYNESADNDQLLNAFTKLNRLLLNDSLLLDVKPLFHFHPIRGQPGLVYMIPTHDLPTGRHSLVVQVQELNKDSLSWTAGRSIYFYK